MGVSVRRAVPARKMLAASPVEMMRLEIKLDPSGCWLWR